MKDLERMIKPKHLQAVVLPFGSFVTGLAHQGSDIDVTVIVPDLKD